MKYDTKDKKQFDAALEYFTKLAGQEALIEIKKINPNRSLSQNAYYHTILGIAGVEIGYTIDQMKTIHKREICPNMFVEEVKGRKFLKSTTRLDTKEMTKAIDQFRLWCLDEGIETPSPDEQEKLIYYQNLIERNQYV